MSTPSSGCIGWVQFFRSCLQYPSDIYRLNIIWHSEFIFKGFGWLYINFSTFISLWVTSRRRLYAEYIRRMVRWMINWKEFKVYWIWNEVVVA
jgi:hypothetical protein